MARFAMCINNSGYEVSLKLRKIYAIVDPEPNDTPDMIRIVDETAEDYLFPKEMFRELETQ